MALVNFPLMAGLAVTAQPLVLLLLSDKWVPCIPYLQMLCVVGLLYPIDNVNLNVLKAMGRSGLYLRLSLVKIILEFISITITCWFGIEALLCGRIAVSLVTCALSGHYAGALLRYSVAERIRDLSPYFGVAALMGSLVYGLPYLVAVDARLLLPVQIVIGGVSFVLLCSLFRLPAFIDGWQTIKQSLAHG